MLEPSIAMPPGVDGVKAVGRVSKADYETVLEPMLEVGQTCEIAVPGLFGMRDGSPQPVGLS